MVTRRLATFFITAIAIPGIALAGFSVDENPRETAADPGDVFFPALVCDVDDGDGTCPPPSLNLPAPLTFDLDAFALQEPLEVCPPDPPFTPGILFSLDDGDPGPGAGLPDNATEIFFYDHCRAITPTRLSYHTSITESFLGLGSDPPPTAHDDDVDAFDTRVAADYYNAGGSLLFSPDSPSNGGLGAGSEAHVWFVNTISRTPAIWAGPIDIGVPDPENCDIDGIAPVFEPATDYVLLFTTDANAPCGLDPGDIYVTDLGGSWALYADDVNDLKIAANEVQVVDIDALAINTGGELQIGHPYQPDDPTHYKADWPNYAPSGMPDFSQDHTTWPPTWCGPTAVSDSLWWFDSEMACDRDLATGQNSEAEPNDLCTQANILGERPPIPGAFSSDPDVDWYVFEIPYKPYRTCTATISTCVLRQAGDADTVLSLWGNCDNSGVPSNLIASNDDGCPPDLQSEIIVDLESGKRYWVKVEAGPGPSAGPTYTLSLGLDCYPMVERYRTSPDDHSEYNPVALIPDLAWCMNTDDMQGTGSGHLGTRIPDMDLCIGSWLINQGLDDSYEKHVILHPSYEEVAREIERSEDVVLLLGFWFADPQGATWTRCGGHYVTAAGVDPDRPSISLSDPALNNAEVGGAGQVRGPTHTDHAPAVSPPPDHDDTVNLSHDLYSIGPPNVPAVSQWSLPTYGTTGAPTTCIDVLRWCMSMEWGQNPAEPPLPQEPCDNPTWTVSAEVEVMVDVSPRQTDLCLHLDSTSVWPNNLRVRKGACTPAVEIPQKDVIRGKLCNLRFAQIVPLVELGYVRCLYDDSNLDEFDELSPDDTRCMGGWFYLVRQSGDVDYGNASSGEPRVPDMGGCP